MAIVYRGKEESIDSLVKRFKTKCIKEGILKSIKAKEFYKSPKEIKLEKAFKNS